MTASASVATDEQIQNVDEIGSVRPDKHRYSISRFGTLPFGGRSSYETVKNRTERFLKATRRYRPGWFDSIMNRRYFAKSWGILIGSAALLGDGLTTTRDGCNPDDDKDAIVVENTTIASKYTGYDEIRERCRGFVRASGQAEMRPETADDVGSVTIRFLDDEGNAVTTSPATNTEYIDEHLSFVADLDTHAALVTRIDDARAVIELQG